MTPDSFKGSVGGGNLEFEAIASARRLLDQAGAPAQQLIPYGLGPALNQCCGGAVTLLFETLSDNDLNWLDEIQDDRPREEQALLITAIDRDEVSKACIGPGLSLNGSFPDVLQVLAQEYLESEQSLPTLVECGEERFFIERVQRRALPLVLFGAGHVARAVVDALANLPFRITWIDARADQFPDSAPANTSILNSPDPVAEIARCPADALYLVMTHSHELDEDICFRVLSRPDCRWLGLIGSTTKRMRFVHRLSKRGLDAKTLEQLICPVGLAGIDGKRPATIAVSIAAQLLAEQVPENWR